MASEKLINYIKEHLEKGITEEVLKEILLKAGWDNQKVEEAFNEINPQKTQEPEEGGYVKEKEPPVDLPSEPEEEIGAKSEIEPEEKEEEPEEVPPFEEPQKESTLQDSLTQEEVSQENPETETEELKDYSEPKNIDQNFGGSINQESQKETIQKEEPEEVPPFEEPKSEIPEEDIKKDTEIPIPTPDSAGSVQENLEKPFEEVSSQLEENPVPSPEDSEYNFDQNVPEIEKPLQNPKSAEDNKVLMIIIITAILLLVVSLVFYFFFL